MNVTADSDPLTQSTFIGGSRANTIDGINPTSIPTAFTNRRSFFFKQILILDFEIIAAVLHGRSLIIDEQALHDQPVTPLMGVDGLYNNEPPTT